MLGLLVLSLPLTSASQARCSRMPGLSPTTAKRFCRSRRTVTSILTPGWTGAFSIILTPGWTGAFSVICCTDLNSATCHIRRQHCRLFLLLRLDQLHIVSVCVGIGLQTQKDTNSICWECSESHALVQSLAWLSTTFKLRMQLGAARINFTWKFRCTNTGSNTKRSHITFFASLRVIC